MQDRVGGGFKYESLWSEDFTEATGLKNKSEYIEWIAQNCFPVIRKLVRKHKPRLIICVGISYKNEYIAAFGDKSAQIKEAIAGDKKLYYLRNDDGAIVVITYFLDGRYGLNSDEKLKKTGEKIAEILAHEG